MDRFPSKEKSILKKPVIALLTDFGTSDHYVGSMKAVILTRCPDAVLLDISHDIPPQSIRAGALALKSIFNYLPEPCIVVCVIDPGVGTNRKILALKAGKRFVLAPDNGVVGEIVHAMRRKPEVRALSLSKPYFPRRISATFHGRDIFAPCAAWLAEDLSRFQSLGPRVSGFKCRKVLPLPRKIRKGWKGEVIYFDHFGNAATNIDADKLKGKSCKVLFRESLVGGLKKNYQTGRQELMAILNSFGFLELAWPNQSARQLKGITIGEPVTVMENI